MNQLLKVARLTLSILTVTAFSAACGTNKSAGAASVKEYTIPPAGAQSFAQVIVPTYYFATSAVWTQPVYGAALRLDVNCSPDIDLSISGMYVVLDGISTYLQPSEVAGWAFFKTPDGLNHTISGFQVIGANYSGQAATCVFSLSSAGTLG